MVSYIILLTHPLYILLCYPANAIAIYWSGPERSMSGLDRSHEWS